MQYKLIYWPYSLSRLIEQATGGKGGPYVEQEASDWTEVLNKYAKDSWRIKDSGTVNSGRDVIFWALLEKEK